MDRPTSRVLVFDQQGRILMMGAVLPGSGERIWVPPGGGGTEGETPVDAATRELLEETGLAVDRAELIGPIARSSGSWTALDGTVYAARDTYFSIFVETFSPNISGFTPLEREIGAYFEWWTADELDVTNDTVYPLGLTRLMRRLARGDIPATPIELPWR